MKRYAQWHMLRLEGDEELARKYLAEGRKYLGFIADQRALGGQQHEFTTRNADGVEFVANFAGAIPILTIRAGGPKRDCEGCEMYLETGQLLFTSDPPAFDWASTDACLAIGGGMHGKLAVETCVTTKGTDKQTEVVVTSGGCWPNLSPAPTPTAHTDPEPLGYSLGGADKTTTQQRLPASCFSGIAHIWVQALYGNPKAHYAEVIAQRSGGSDNTSPDYMASVLAIPAYDANGALTRIRHLAFQHSANTGFTALHNTGTSGVVRFGSAYALAEIGTDRVNFYRIKFSDCAKRALLLSRRYAIGSAERTALLAYAFADAYPEQAVTSTVMLSTLPSWGTQYGPYGWKFNASGTEASAVLAVGQNYGDPPPNHGVECVFRRARIAFGGTLDAPQAVLSAVETASAIRICTPVWSNLIGYYAPTCWIEGGPWYSTPNAGTYGTVYSTSIADRLLPGRIASGASHDVPVYCWYVGDTLRVVRYRLAHTATLAADANTGDCYINYPQRIVLSSGFYLADADTADDVDMTCDYDLLADGSLSTRIEIGVDGFYDRESPLLNLDLDVSEHDYTVPILHIPYGAQDAVYFVTQTVAAQNAETRTIPEGSIGWSWSVWNESITVQFAYGSGGKTAVATHQGTVTTGPTGSDSIPCFNEMAEMYPGSAPFHDAGFSSTHGFMSSSTTWSAAGEKRLRYRIKRSLQGAAVYIHGVFSQAIDENNPSATNVTATNGYSPQWKYSSFIGWA